ncbi:MAG: GNAT family N-acetyltransferase [Crocinitomicaceae bacterium]|nr:GNAT family N-acetyltransferase [Crocinitomicaceae bacterium]
MAIDLSYIIPPVDKSAIKKELSAERWIRKTNKLENDIYIVNHHNSPNVMREIGRLREITFALSGGGTGKSMDIDDGDTADICYDQLIVYSPEDEEIVSGYRFIDCAKVAKNELYKKYLSTAHYFNFSEQFTREYLPYTIELGRSWVQPAYQPTQNPRKGLFALDNLWDGLGALVITHKHIQHFYGKVTMYPTYDKEARNALLSFMNHFFPDKDGLVIPKTPLVFNKNNAKFIKLIKDAEYKEAYKVLSRFAKARNESIPPLINQYMSLSATMKTFGTCVNKDFGDVEESGILITIADVYPEKSARHLAV